MSIIYCHDCNQHIDTDFNIEHFNEFGECIETAPDPYEYESYEEYMEAQRTRENR